MLSEAVCAREAEEKVKTYRRGLSGGELKMLRDF
jgi:hypothetical protein